MLRAQLGLLLAALMPITAAAQPSNGVRPLPKLSEWDFKGSGIVQFAPHGFALTTTTETAVNHSVRQLLERHQAIFGFQTRAGFQVRMRLFGNYQDYTNATFALYWTNALDRQALGGRPFTVAGYYVPASKEIVTWRQQLPGFLGTTLLHEAGHAIMDAHFENIPMWLLEGSAEYFAFALHPPGELQQRMLRYRWTRLGEWQQAKSLPPLKELLDVSAGGFRAIEPEKAYATSWSLFQLLVASDANRRVVVALLNERQGSTTADTPEACSAQVERLYPGGLPKLEAAWQAWIARGASATNEVRSPARKR